jgi:hypothetical protein
MKTFNANFLLSTAVILSFTFFEACGQQHTNEKISKQPFIFPKDSATWNLSVTEKYYSRALMKLFEDGTISRSEAQIIDRQHGHLAIQDSLKLKEYVFMMAKAVNDGKKPLTPLEFDPKLRHANDTIFRVNE